MQLFDEILIKRVQPKSNWLDAGCGSGVLSKLLLDKGAIVLGIDGSSRMLKEAEKHIIEFREDGPIGFQLVKTVEELTGIEQCFDGVLCSSVIEYVETPKLALEEFRRILKPEGVLVISVPNKLSLVRIGQKILRAFGKLIGKDISPYLAVSVNDYSKLEFLALLNECGFHCLEYEQFDPVVGSRSKWWPGSLHMFVAVSTTRPNV